MSSIVVAAKPRSPNCRFAALMIAAPRLGAPLELGCHDAALSHS